MTKLSLFVIRFYKAAASPLFSLFSSCRYTPCCSDYGYEAIQRFGFRRGWSLALRRVGRCRPFGGSGYDPVPDHFLSGSDRRAARHALRRRHRHGRGGAPS